MKKNIFFAYSALSLFLYTSILAGSFEQDILKKDKNFEIESIEGKCDFLKKNEEKEF